MKIFAREGDKLFAQLTRDEWAQLQGFRTDWDRTRHRGQNEVQAGSTLDVAAWCSAARDVADQVDKLTRLRDEFAGQVERLDQAIAAVGPPRIEAET